MGKNVEKVMVNKDDYDKFNRKVEIQAIENQEMKGAMANQNKKIHELEETIKSCLLSNIEAISDSLC